MLVSASVCSPRICFKCTFVQRAEVLAHVHTGDGADSASLEESRPASVAAARPERPGWVEQMLWHTSKPLARIPTNLMLHIFSACHRNGISKKFIEATMGYIS